MLSALARQTGIDHKSITCYMMGEHGNQQFAPWSCVSFRGMPLDTWARATSASASTATRCRRSPSAAAGSHSPASSARSTASPPPPPGWPTPCCTMKRSFCPQARS
ncbi:MAG: hypothetical protein ACLUGA_12640 [Oscillospiraceae bacterium]